MEEHLLDKEQSFESLGLDPRLLRAIEKKLGWDSPTLVQAEAIPLALQGKDVLAKARTGSGKTAAYSIPMLQKILDLRKQNVTEPGVRGLVLVPTRELCQQVFEHCQALTHYCSDTITLLSLSTDLPFKTQKARLSELPDVLICTPKLLHDHLQKKTVTLKHSLSMVVVDEADFIFSYGFEEDIRAIVEHLPTIYQAFLMSATLSEDVRNLKELMLRTPAVLKLEEQEDTTKPVLSQHSIYCSEKDKFLMAYFMLKMKLLAGKALFFVNDIERCFRLKLFFERFSIKAAVLNSELPLNSRYNIIQQFNKGIFDYLIATDETKNLNEDEEEEEGEEQYTKGAKVVESNGDYEDIDEYEEDEDSDEQGEENEEQEDDEEDEDEEEDEQDEEEEEDSATEVTKQKGKEKEQAKHKKSKREETTNSEEYGVSRGIDFQNVKVVVNFDFPTSVKNYIHRVGRTGRGKQSGTAISFVTPQDGKMLQKVKANLEEKGSEITPYTFKMALVEGFRYRVEDVLRGVTRAAVREARLREIKQEIINSEKLKTHFEENPEDLRTLLKHDRPLMQSRVQPHLKFVPRYLAPTNLVGQQQKKINDETQRSAEMNRKRRRRSAIVSKKSQDPLKSFSTGRGIKREFTLDGEEEGGEGSSSTRQRRGFKKGGRRQHNRKRARR
ncbi:putative ATP-dependent RNA helicase ddx56 [Balamuthia mandrillaris]